MGLNLIIAQEIITKIKNGESSAAILGLEPQSTSTPAEVKQAYYQLALKIHPDKNSDDRDNETVFQIAL